MANRPSSPHLKLEASIYRFWERMGCWRVGARGPGRGDRRPGWAARPCRGQPGGATAGGGAPREVAQREPLRDRVLNGGIIAEHAGVTVPQPLDGVGLLQIDDGFPHDVVPGV